MDVFKIIEEQAFMGTDLRLTQSSCFYVTRESTQQTGELYVRIDKSTGRIVIFMYTEFSDEVDEDYYWFYDDEEDLVENLAYDILTVFEEEGSNF